MTKENEAKEKTLFRQVFSKLLKKQFENHQSFSKFPPRLRKFLTKMIAYTYEKEPEIKIV